MAIENEQISAITHYKQQLKIGPLCSVSLVFVFPIYSQILVENTKVYIPHQYSTPQ